MSLRMFFRDALCPMFRVFSILKRSSLFGIFLTFTFATHLYAQESGEDVGQSNREFVLNLTQPEVSEILEIKKKNKDEMVAVISNLQLNVGEHGVVMRDLGSYQTIVANVEVTEVNGAKAKIKTLRFRQLAQPYLPTPNLEPMVGDKVIFRSFNDKAFIIAPDEESYNDLALEYPFIQFISSDLLMGFLNSQGKHDPTSKTLPSACNEYGVGIVFVIGSKNVGILGCQNLAKLFKYKNVLPDTVQPKSPFYTRVHFEGGGSLTYSLSSKKSKDYFKYYDSLIGDLVNP